METIALRYADNIAPEGGTIIAHQKIIDQKGFVWYGKFGLPLSNKVKGMILANEKPRVLLIQSGKSLRHWAYLDQFSSEEPPKDDYPAYYQEKADHVRTWLRIVSFQEADADIMKKCFVKSSGAPLSNASKHSMCPYFIINVNEDL